MEVTQEITRERLIEMQNADVTDIDPAELVDISTVKINTDLPIKERVKDYIRQIKNPYCYKNHGLIVKVSFSGKGRLEDCLKMALFPETEEQNRTFVKR